jgi:Lanthionine synthetase C-like protein
MPGPEASAGLDSTAAVAMLQWALYHASGSSRWSELGHQTMIAATRAGVEDGSLVRGWSGIGVAAEYAAARTPRYQGLIRNIRAALAERLLAAVDDCAAPLESSSEYELLMGYTGIYLSLDRSENRDAVTRVLDRFEWILSDRSNTRWFLPNKFDQMLTGAMNRLGVSHGIAGLLGALNCNGTTDRERKLAVRVAEILCDAAVSDPWGVQWGYHLSDAVSGERDTLYGRVAWCHYSLGIAACLWDAGHVWNKREFSEIALAAAVRIAEAPIEAWYMRDYTICHGIAGNAILLRHIGLAAMEPRILRVVDILTKQLIAGYDPSLPFGYESFWADQRISDPGFLMGASGIGLALLTLTGAVDEAWLKAMAVKGS